MNYWIFLEYYVCKDVLRVRNMDDVRCVVVLDLLVNILEFKNFSIVYLYKIFYKEYNYFIIFNLII